MVVVDRITYQSQTTNLIPHSSMVCTNVRLVSRGKTCSQSAGPFASRLASAIPSLIRCVRVSSFRPLASNAPSRTTQTCTSLDFKALKKAEAMLWNSSNCPPDWQFSWELVWRWYYRQLPSITTRVFFSRNLVHRIDRSSIEST